MKAPDAIAHPLPDCPTCGGTGLMALCGKPTKWGGRCVMRAGHHFHCHGQDDVTSDWAPALHCSTCQNCPGCGSVLPPSRVCRYHPEAVARD